MMKFLQNKIKIHRSLMGLSGHETAKSSLLAIICSVSFTALTLTLVRNVDISIMKKITLTIIALDIGGVAVANFSAGTNNYYAESLSKRYFFILFLLLQPLILTSINKE